MNLSAHKILILVLLAAFFLRVYPTNEIALNHDEELVYRRILNDETVWQIPFGGARISHHVFALVVARGAMEIFGNFIFSLRWPSILMSVLSVVLIYKIGQWAFNKKVGIIAALLLTLNPYALYYTYNSRGYAAMMFYVLIVYYLAILAFRSNRWWYWVAIGTIMSLALYNHLYTVFAWPGLFWLILIWSWQKKQLNLRLWKRMAITMIVSLALTVVLYSPILWRGYTNENSVIIEMQRPPVAPSPFWTLSWFSGSHLDELNPDQTVYYLLMGLLIVGSGLILFNKPLNYRAYCLLGWFLLPLLIYHLGNWFIFPSILGRPRYFGFVLPFFLLIVAVSPFKLAKLTRRLLAGHPRLTNVYYVIIPIVMALWIVPIREMYSREATGNWPGVSNYLSQNVHPLDIILCESFEHEWWNDDYYDQNGNCRRNIGYWLDTKQAEPLFPVRNLGYVSRYDDIKSFDVAQLTRHRQVWVVYWGIPADVDFGNVSFPEWDRFGRTVVIPPPPASNAVEAVMRHIEQLDKYYDEPKMRLIHHARLAQLASIQGETERAAEEWNYVERLQEEIETIPPELEQFLEVEKEALESEPLLQP